MTAFANANITPSAKVQPFTYAASALLALSLIFFFSTLLFAQYTYTLDKTTRFGKLGINEGLSTDLSRNIHQDKYGFIWIGTQRGLNLYDGYQVKSFMADPNDSTAIINDYINTIYEDEDGTMWFGTRKGISRFNRANQTFSNYDLDSAGVKHHQANVYQMVSDGDHLWIANYSGLYRFKKSTETFTWYGEDTLNPEKGIKGSGSAYLFIDKSGTLWINSWQSGGPDVLNRFNKESNTFTHFEHDPANPESFAGMRIRSIIEDRLGTLWMAARGGGLIEMTDKEAGKFRYYRHDDSDSSSVISDGLNCVFQDSHGQIWTAGAWGFSEFNKETGEFINYSLPYVNNNPDWSINISDIIEGPEGDLWMNSAEGFFRFDPAQKQLIHYVNDPDNDNSLSNNYINQIIIDQSGQIWVSTWSRGVCLINPYSNAFKHIQKKPNLKSSLLDNFVTDMFADSEDNFWIGTFGGGLNRTKISHGEILESFEHFIFDVDDPNSISSNIITYIYEDRNNFLWFSTYNGLNKYNPKNKKFTSYRTDLDDDSAISELAVLAVCEDSHGTFWVGTVNGLNIMDTETGKFTRILPDADDPKSITNNYISVIYEDSEGEIWFGSEHPERLNRKDTSFIHVKNISTIYDIIEDDSTNLWFTSCIGGLFHWNRKSQQFKAITVEQGLPTNYIFAVEIDDNNDIWAGSSSGLSRINGSSYKVKNYDVTDGLVSGEVCQRARFKDKDGWLYFGTRNGITYFHPDSIKENTYIPPVYVTGLKINGNQKYFNKPVYETDTVELQHNEGNISFDFVALNYVNTQKNQYAYMLEGYDEDWNYAGDRRTAYYTNLNPGTYTFRVKGSNNDGYWNEEGASLMVIIHPPFWKTWWAYGLYVFIFLGLLYWVRRYELNRLHLKQDLEIKQVEADKMAELDHEKNKFFSNISHEFRTPLTLILGPLDRFVNKLKDKDQVNEINLVRRNARRLQTLINQLLSLSKLESGNLKLKARPENVVRLARLLLDSFHSLAEDRDIKIEFESDVEECIVYIDKLKFEKIVNNLLSNAFKFTEKGGKIKVSVSSASGDEKDGVTIKFLDTGIGIRKERLQHVFDRFYQVDEQQKKSDLGTGIGLALTKELVELHHGEITLESEFGIGTAFTVFLPLGKDHLSEEEFVESATHTDEMDDEMLQGGQILVPDAVTKTVTGKADIQQDSDLPLLLIVEDNADMRAYIKSYLTETYQVMEASNGKEGADMAIKHLPDLIVSDLMMPFMDGNEMTRLLKSDERTSHIPIILLTAKASTASKLEGLETGADDFLTKPFDAAELLVRIRNLIEQRQKLREILSRFIGDNTQTKIIRQTAGKAMSKLDEQFLKKVKTAVENNMSNPEFSVEMLAQEVAMSRSQLHRKLKSLTDVTPTDFIRDIRLQKAAELLKAKELNITQVTYEIGISSLSYFAKVFKEKYGVPPSDYSKP